MRHVKKLLVPVALLVAAAACTDLTGLGDNAWMDPSSDDASPQFGISTVPGQAPVANGIDTSPRR